MARSELDVQYIAPVVRNENPSPATPKQKKASWNGHSVAQLFITSAGVVGGMAILGILASLIYKVVLKIREFFIEKEKIRAEKAEEIVYRKMPGELLDKIRQVPLNFQKMILGLADTNSRELAALTFLMENYEISIEQLTEILKGAHLRLYDHGFMYQKFKPVGTERISSHPSTLEQFSIRGNFGKEWLFGIKLPENDNEVEQFTTMQLERHDMNSLFAAALHVATYFKYLISGKNQGPYGSSIYTDKNPLELQAKEGSELHVLLNPPTPVVDVVIPVVPKQLDGVELTVMPQAIIHAKSLEPAIPAPLTPIFAAAAA